MRSCPAPARRPGSDRMRYDAVIFDLFGTLVEPLTREGAREHRTRMSAALGIAPEDFTHHWSDATFEMRATGAFPTVEDNLVHICRLLGVPSDDGRVEAAAAVRRELVARGLTPRDDAVPALRRLKALGCRTGLASDCSPDVPGLFAETPLAPYIDAPFFSCTAGVRKPDARIYRMVCEALRVPPARCLFVGDGDSRELTGAVNAGMAAVLIRVPGDRGLRRFEDAWAGPRISALSEVPPLVEDGGAR